MVDDVRRLLSDMHNYAHAGMTAGFFDCFTPEAVIVGTAQEERWTREEFRKEFPDGLGNQMPYQQLDCWVYDVADGRVASFDEVLLHPTYNYMRGSGMALLTEDGWKVAHYVYSFVIPNEIVDLYTEINSKH